MSAVSLATSARTWRLGPPGVLDVVTGGASTAIMGAVVPGFDCFVADHHAAFEAGKIVGVITEVAVAVASIVVSAGAATGAVVAEWPSRSRSRPGRRPSSPGSSTP